jgi:hypothetical protein
MAVKKVEEVIPDPLRTGSLSKRMKALLLEYQDEKSLDPQLLMNSAATAISDIDFWLKGLIEEGVRQVQLEQFNLEISKRKEQWEALKQANPDTPPFRLKRQFSNKSTVQVGPFTTNIFIEQESK